MGKKVICILGPTGVGKTKLSVEIAKKLNGEIINADSTQVYKTLNIATAKIKEEEKEGIKHHLFDIKNIDENYTIYDYQKDCRNVIKEIQEKNKIPIIVGGSGLYIKAALYNYIFNDEKEYNSYDDYTNDELYELLTKIATKRGALKKGGVPDYDKVYNLIIKDLKDNNFGNITLDRMGS